MSAFSADKNAICILKWDNLDKRQKKKNPNKKNTTWPQTQVCDLDLRTCSEGKNVLKSSCTVNTQCGRNEFL